MATSTTDYEIEDQDNDVTERTNSSRGQLLMVIANILTTAVEPKALGLALGFSESQVAETDEGLVEAKNKILRLLKSFSDQHDIGWHAALIEIVETKLDNLNLARELRNAVSNQHHQTSKTRTQSSSDKGSIKDDSKSGTRDGKGLDSGHTSSWEMASRSRGSQSQGEHHLSQSFEQVSEENLFMLRDGDPLMKQEDIHGSVDQPEMSLHISQVGDALRVVSDLLGSIEGIKQLPEVIPQILTVARQMKTQKVLRHVFEEENSNLKEDLQNANKIMRELREQIGKLESEFAELKRASEDKSLGDFDYVTKKEAHEVKEEEIKDQEKSQQTASAQATPQTQSSEGVSVEAYETVQKKNIVLKQKLSQVVKLNHSWDEQYHRMESALRQKIEASEQETAERKKDWEKREKERDEILVQAKHRVEKAEAETAELTAFNEQMKQQLNKINRYATSLKGHKQDLETEVKRLNEALEQKLQITEKPVVAAPPPTRAAAQGKSKSKAGNADGASALISREERSLLASLTPDALIEELGLLKQQVDIYKSDFDKEQRDRQRAMGELDEVKTELHRTKKKMEKQKSELQILHDQALAYQFYATEHNRGHRAPMVHQQARPVPKPRASPQDNVYNALRGAGARGPPQYQNVGRKREPEELVPHGVNYAMNDEYSDAAEDFQICYPPSSSFPHDGQQGEQSRDNDPYYHEIS